MKNVLLVVGLSIVFNVPASCQDGWRTTTFLTPGLGKVLKEDRLALSGMAGFQFGIQQGRFITGAGLNVAYLQSRQSRPLLSNVGPASQPFLELPIGVGVATRATTGFHYEAKADIGYLTNLNFSQHFITFSPHLALVWSREEKGSIGLVLKATKSIKQVEAYQPAFVGMGVMFQHF